jgi:DNA-binding response OmpR family regulator
VRVLLVEDEGAIAALLEETFQDHGFDVAVAGYADEAIRLLEAEPGGFPLLVTDVQLGPGGDGFDVARRARELDPDVRVVFMTGHAEADVAGRGVADALIAPKPFTPEQLVQLILGRWGELARGGA